MAPSEETDDRAAVLAGELRSLHARSGSAPDGEWLMRFHQGTAIPDDGAT